MQRSGHADLPLHYGRVPPWLADRMTALGGALVEAIVREGGTKAFLSRLSDPFWFQALGCVMGMDWHSSGITTSVMGALKRALNPRAHELGLYVCGGRGRHALNTPRELEAVGEKTGLDGMALGRCSRLAAKVDNTCLQDGFTLYLHSFVVSREGEWAVVQQGMHGESAMARRYHWHSAALRSFVDNPQCAIVGENRGQLLNLSDMRSQPARQAIEDFLRQPLSVQEKEIRYLSMPRNHTVTRIDVDPKRLGAVLALAHESPWHDFVDALLLPGLGPRTLQSLAFISEVIYGAPSRFSDPARFSFAHGGKDGHPFPVPVKIYDESIAFLRQALEKARMGESDKLHGLQNLHALARRLEVTHSPHAETERVIEKERRIAPLYGGRTVFDGRPVSALVKHPIGAGNPDSNFSRKKILLQGKRIVTPRPPKLPISGQQLSLFDQLP